LPCFFVIYIYICFCFFSHKGAQTGANHEKKKNIAGALAFGSTRRGWSGLLSGPVTVVPERDAGGDRRTRSRVGVGAGRDAKRRLFSLFLCDQRTVAAGETERRRLVFQGLEKKKKTPDQ
jgi:hypothetical protein